MGCWLKAAAILACSLTTLAAAKISAKPPDDIFAANNLLGRGINFGNALDAPREGAWGVTLQADYFAAVKEAGFQTVRLPVRWSAHALSEAPYTIASQFAERVDWAVDQALANKLNIIINVHHYDELFADPEKHLVRLVSLWEQIATRYQNRPAAVYFELLNEPHDKLNEARWNTVLPQLLAAVRKTNPTRPVIVGPAQWNGIRALDKLELPGDDHQLIVTVHYYDPMRFTHQGASWVNGADKWKGTKWTGTEAERAGIGQAFDRAATWAKSHNRPIFLGEFGAFEQADLESRTRWTRAVTSEAERLGFSWAYWEFCAGFGVYNARSQSWREPLRTALIR